MMLSTLTPIHILAPLFAALIAAPAPLPTDLPDELSNVPRPWLRQNWQEQHERAAYLIAAYDLGEEIRPAFWHDFYTLLADLSAYEKTFFEETGKLSPDEMLKRYQAYPNEMPTSDEKLMAMVESLLDPADFSLPRQRYLELRERRNLGTWVAQDESILTKNLRRWFKNARLTHDAHRTEAGRPMPYWVYINQRNQAIRDETQSLTDKREARLAVRRQSSRPPGGAAFRRHQATIKPPLEPEDSIAHTPVAPIEAGLRIHPVNDTTRRTWHHAVNEYTSQHAFTDIQRDCAASVFKLIWHRAEQLRTAHSANYAVLEKTANKKAYAKRLNELDRNLAGLYGELQCRLAFISES